MNCVTACFVCAVDRMKSSYLFTASFADFMRSPLASYFLYVFVVKKKKSELKHCEPGCVDVFSKPPCKNARFEPGTLIPVHPRLISNHTSAAWVLLSGGLSLYSRADIFLLLPRHCQRCQQIGGLLKVAIKKKKKVTRMRARAWKHLRD